MLPTSPTDLSTLHLGATRLPEGSVAFKVWAPRCRQVDLVIQTPPGAAKTGASQPDQQHPMQRLPPSSDRTCSPPGTFAVLVPNVPPGSLYAFRLDGGTPRPDPRSQFQPAGVHGYSQVVDHARFSWTDQNWPGIATRQLVIYEVHVGCASPEGTYAGLATRLARLKELGITAIELMPVAETPGRWNWGYDGVHLYAPKAAYGTPDDLKRLVDQCHAAGLAVLLDVVYNHLGPEGNYLREFGPYFSKQFHTPWGEALNYSGRQREAVRQWILDNARHWLETYHFDGLRLDAIHFMHDTCQPSITQQLADEVAGLAQRWGRPLHLIAESNVFDPRLLPSSNQAGYAAMWSDCFLHSIYSMAQPQLRLARRRYWGAADVGQALRYGYVYQGNTAGQVQRVVEPRSTTPPATHQALVMALQTHDSVGNHPQGMRLHHLADRDFQMAAAALMLLSPTIPQIFMGEEAAVESPFFFFSDFLDPGLRRAVDRGRRREYPEHRWKGSLLPSNPRAFEISGWPAEQHWDWRVWRWYRRLIQLRRSGLEQGWLDARYANWKTPTEAPEGLEMGIEGAPVATGTAAGDVVGRAGPADLDREHAGGGGYFQLAYRSPHGGCLVRVWLRSWSKLAADAPVEGAADAVGEAPGPTGRSVQQLDSWAKRDCTAEADSRAWLQWWSPEWQA